MRDRGSDPNFSIESLNLTPGFEPGVKLNSSINRDYIDQPGGSGFTSGLGSAKLRSEANDRDRRQFFSAAVRISYLAYRC